MISHPAPDPPPTLHLYPKHDGDLEVVVNGESHSFNLKPRYAITLLVLIDASKEDEETSRPRNGWRTAGEIGDAYSEIAGVAAPTDETISHYFSFIKTTLLTIDVEVFESKRLSGYRLTREITVIRTPARSRSRT